MKYRTKHLFLKIHFIMPFGMTMDLRSTPKGSRPRVLGV